MPKSVLKKAYRLYKSKKFSEVIRLLESQIFRFRNNSEFYSLLGSACLYSGDFGGAESYLKRAEQLNIEDVQALLGLAAINIKRSEIEEAVKKWLKILDLEPGNPTARNGLNLIRNNPSIDEIRIKSMFPPILFNPAVLLIPGLLLLLSVLILTGILHFLPRLEPKGERPGIADIALSPEHPPLISYHVDALITLSEKEIEETFESVKNFLLQYRDNLALREANRIIISNASAYVKERARLLKTFVQEPDFTTLKDNFSYSEVLSEPHLYEGCYATWAGKVANLQIGDKAIRFDLLVGYQQEEELMGIVPVTLDFASDLENGSSVEVLGKIQVIESGLALAGKSLHKLLSN